MAALEEILIPLGAAILAGLSGGGIAALLRVGGSTWPRLAKPFLWHAGKPWGCPVCLGGWMALLALLGWSWALDLLPQRLGAWATLICLQWPAAAVLAAKLADSLRPLDDVLGASSDDAG